MGLFDSITTWMRKEKADIGEALDEVTQSLDHDLTRKERELTATPEQRLEMLQDQIADDPFAEVRDRIEAATAHADATADLSSLDEAALDDPAAKELDETTSTGTVNDPPTS